MQHNQITGKDAVHVAAFVGAANPALDAQNQVAANKFWVDTTDADNPILKIRNAANNGWKQISNGNPGGGSASVNGPDKPPNAPDPLNDEFDASSLDSDWDDSRSQSVLETTFNDKTGSAVESLIDIDGTGRLFLEKPFAPSGNFSLTMAGWTDAGYNYGGIDLFIRDGGDAAGDPEAPDPDAIHNNDYWVTYNFSAALKFEVHRRVGGATREYALVSTNPFTDLAKAYMHVQRVGAIWTFACSNNGFNWRSIYTSNAHNFAPTKLMLGIRGNATAKTRGAIDWVRKDWIYI